MLHQNPEEGLRELQQLLQVEDVNSAIRIGDIYALLIEYHANRQRWKQAYSILQEMRQSVPEQSIKFYVNQNLLMQIHRELNIEYKPSTDENTFSGGKQDAKQSGNYDANDDDIRDNVGYGGYDD